MTDNPTKSPRCDNAQSRLRARVFLARYAHLSLSETEGMTDDDLQTACENVAGFLQAELYRQKVPAPIRIEPPEVRLDPPVIRRTDPEGLLETLSQPLPARLHGAAAEMVQRFKVAGVSMLGSDELADLQRRAAERDLLLAEIEADDVAVALDRMRSTAATLKTLDGILGAFEEPEKCDSTEPKIVRRARGAVEMLGLPMALLRQQAAAVAKPTLDAVESERVRAVQRIRELEAEVVSLREQRERVGDELGRLTHFIASDGRLAQHCIAGEPVAVAAIRLLDLARKRIAELQKERDEAEERARSALELREDMRRLTTEPIVKIAAAVHMQDATTAAEVADAAVARIEALERDVDVLSTVVSRVRLALRTSSDIDTVESAKAMREAWNSLRTEVAEQRDRAAKFEAERDAFLGILREAERVLIEAGVPAVTSDEPCIVRLARGAVQAIKGATRPALQTARRFLGWERVSLKITSVDREVLRASGVVERFGTRVHAAPEPFRQHLEQPVPFEVDASTTPPTCTTGSAVHFGWEEWVAEIVAAHLRSGAVEAGLPIDGARLRRHDLQAPALSPVDL